MNFLMGIPMMNVAGAKEAKTTEKGGSNYVTVVEGTTKEDYLAYLNMLEEYGFEKYADNAEGLGGTVFYTTFTREELVLTVVYYALQRQTSISFYTGKVSEHLIYQDSYVAGNQENVNTKLHMLELWRFGNSFVFQLKNGHFIISDGGLTTDLPYLLDYLESLMPEGEKPIVDAWVISHAHGDHCGALNGFMDHTKWMTRIYCEGVYFSEPNNEVTILCGGELGIAKMKWITRWLLDSNGNMTNFYRPQTGQRYYFNDITMDILLSQEIVPMDAYHGDLNTSSTVCMFTVEGQKCFFSGDIHQDGLKFIIDNYTKEFLQLDLFTLNHHGFNTSVSFVDYVTIKTALLTVQGPLPVRKIRDTKYLISKVQETMVWGDGTKILTFPYKIGTYECLPQREWIYNEGEERILQPNIYTFGTRRLFGFIFDADAVLFDGKTLKAGLKELLNLLKENGVHMSVYSGKTTAELTAELKRTGIYDYYELILGSDQLDADNLCTAAIAKSEAKFRLDHIHKYVVVCNNLEVVEAAVSQGIKTIVIKEGREISAELELKCWQSIDSLEGFPEFFERSRILFE